MISHGSQIITDLRRGTWRITSMTRGTFDILGTFTTPYSPLATAALKAAFPTQWETIRDYGFAHPEIVGYMNAYAVEDPKIAYSLVEGIGTRWLVGDGTSYVNTGYVYTSNFGSYCRFKVNRIVNDRWVGFFTNYSNGNKDQSIFGIYNNKFAFSLYEGRNPTIPDVMPATADLLKHDVYINYPNKGTRLDDIIVNSEVIPLSFTNTYPAYIFSRSGTLALSASTLPVNIAICELLQGNEKVRHFIPFKLGVARSADQVYPSSKGAQAVGTLGMLDLVTGLFHPNANSSGSFSESIESPS